MAIEEQLDEALKQAMRSRDQPTMDVVRMLKARVAERRTAKGFTGQIDDALLLEVIAAYRKQLQKGLEEYARLGDKAKPQIEKLRFEIDFCSRFLPATLDEAHLEQLVRDRIAALDVKEPEADRPSRRRRQEDAQGAGRAGRRQRIAAGSRRSTL
jgi:uncharacterized protein YqeY